MQEIWKPVVGYEGHYEVSDLGQVRSLDRLDARGWRISGRILRPATDSKGYLQIGLWLDGQKSFKVQRLVLAAFVGPCPDGREAAHGNGVRIDNRLVNLRWATQEENEADKWIHGTMPTNSALCAGDIDRIFDLHANRCTKVAIANRFGVTDTCIRNILNGKRWARHRVSLAA